MKRTGYFLRLVQDGSVYIKGTVYVRDREDLAILASGTKRRRAQRIASRRPCPATARAGRGHDEWGVAGYW